MKSANTFAFIAGLCLWITGTGVRSSMASIPYFGMGGGDSHTTLAIKSDGSCLLTNENVQPRKMMELQIRTMERYSKMSEETEEESSTASAQTSKGDAKAISDDELVKKIREMYDTQFAFNEESGWKIDALEVSTNTVRVVMHQAFGALKELLGESPWSWGPNLLMIENTRFETDTNGLLRVTFLPSKGSERYVKTMAGQWRNSKTKFSWKLILPGKVVSSGLPETQDNATGVTLDSSKPESINSVLKIMGVPIVITAQGGGLKLDAALESQKLFRAGRNRSRSQPELPITDAGPGFVAEPVGVAVSTVYYFPEGGKYAKDLQTYGYGAQPTGTVVTAKLFPPKGRTIQSVSGLRVLKAKDDKGRAIAVAGGDDAGAASDSEMFFSQEGSDKSGMARLDLHLGLPAGDAQTIEDVEAEGVVLSIGGWKEFTVTNVQADAQKEIDLTEILPGAKLIITKVTSKKPQTTVQARLEGPAGVNQLDVKLKMEEGQGSSHMQQQKSKTSGEKTVRSITVQGYDFHGDRRSSAPPITLIVRSPQDSKRERVRFKLTALDLL